MSAARRPMAARIYRILLQAYPPAFRARHGVPMVEVFLAKYADVRAREGPVRRARFWLATLADVGRNAFAERTRPVRRAPAARAPRRVSLSTVVHDLRFAFRRIAKDPGFALAAILTLALGIGANTAIFSAVHGVMLSPLGFPDPGRLVQLWQSDVSRGGRRSPVSPGLFLDWQQRTRSLEGLALYAYTTGNLAGFGDPERIPIAVVSAGFFSTLGVQPELGQGFLPEDRTPGADPVVVVSHAFWLRKLQGSDRALGSTIELNNLQHVVVGVMPAGLEHLSWRGADLWLVREPDPDDRRSLAFRVVARLKAGVSPAQARSDLAAVQAQLHTEVGEPDLVLPDALVVPLHDDIVRGTETPLWMLQAAAVLVLLITCANLASVLLARGSARGKEMAVRAALGAGRRRLVRQLLTETCLVALLGGLLGLLVANWMVVFLVASLPAEMPRLQEIGLDGTVLAVSLALSLGTGLAFGIVPAFRVLSGGLDDALRQGGRGDRAARPRTLGAFVVAQVAIAVVLLTGAGLMAESFVRLQQIDPGFDTDGTLAVEVSLPLSQYPESDRQVAFFETLEQHVRALPAVRTVGVVNTLPLSQSWSSNRFAVEGRNELDQALFYRADPGYLAAMGIPLQAGRWLTSNDTVGAPLVAVVSESLARRVWPDGGAVGARVRVGFGDNEPWRAVVGVVGDVRHVDLVDGYAAGIYVPFAQAPFSRAVMVVRASVPPATLADSIRAEVRRLDPKLPVFNVRTLDALHDEAVRPARIVAGLMGVFSLLALGLGAIGLYGVVTYATVQRTQEIGVRMALGARPGDILRAFVGEGLRLVFVGLAIGMLAALSVAPLVASVLYGVAPTDPKTIASVAGLLLVVGAAASYLPARRATRIDPIVALRVE